MEITQEEFNRISKIEDNDDAFEETLKLFEPYLQRYEVYFKEKNLESIDIDVFKRETKIIFGLLHYVFSTVDLDDSDTDEDDKEKFLALTTNTRYVYTNIENAELDKESDPKLTEAIQYIRNYFGEQAEHMKAAEKCLSDTCDMLENFKDSMEISVRLNKINTSFKEKSASKEELIEEKKWCQTTLRDFYDKDDVMAVIQNYHSPQPQDYAQLAQTCENKEYRNKYIKYMQINNIVSTILIIETYTKD